MGATEIVKYTNLNIKLDLKLKYPDKKAANKKPNK
jgi:hypothetical protein